MIAYAAKLKTPAPAARPSSPSVRLTAFDVAYTSTTAQRTQPMGPKSRPNVPGRANDSSVLTFVSWPVATAKLTATMSRPAVFRRAFNPRLRSRLTLIQSSRKPTRPGSADRGHDEETAAGEDATGDQVGQHVADDGATDDGQATHGGSSGLHLMTLGTILANGLTDVPTSQHVDQHTGTERAEAESEEGGHEQVGSSEDLAQHGRCNEAIVEIDDLVTDDLVVLVTLAGDEHDVPSSCGSNGVDDCLCPIRLDVYVRRVA